MNKKSKQFLSAGEIAKLIIRAYKRNEGVFTNKVNAEDNLPPNLLNIDKAQFLFYVIQMDYATKSSKLYKNANKTWKTHPKLFNSQKILQMQDQNLKNLIANNFHPRYVNEIVKRFQINSKKLLNQYSGKAFNITDKANTAQELLNLIKEFRGFGPKLGNFLLRTYIDSFNLKFPDIYDIKQPVDIHDVRLTYEWGLINSKKTTSTNIKEVKDLWNQVCKKEKLDWIKLDKAMWLIGSEGKHTNNPKKDFYHNIGKTYKNQSTNKE